MASLSHLDDVPTPSGGTGAASPLRFHRRSGASPDADRGGLTAWSASLTRPLERVRATLGAGHASLLRLDPRDRRLEVVAATGTPFLAPGMNLPAAASTLVTELAAGGEEHVQLGLCDAPVEGLAYASGLSTALVLPIEAAEPTAAAGAVYLAWTDSPPFLDAAQSAVALEAHALAVLLEPPAVVGARVLIAHPDPLVADGIARHAERQLGVVATSCSTLSQLLATLKHARPDLIASSDRLAEDETLTSVASRVRAAGAAAPLMALPRAETPQNVADALRAGISGYVPLTDGADRIVEAMAAVLDGRAVLPDPRSESTTPQLTSREQDVLRGLDRGLSYDAIAGELQVAPSTVKSHSRQLFRKLDVSSRTAALHRARVEGLL